MRYVLLRLDQGWSPVASSAPAEEGEWGVLKLSAARDGRFVPSENKALEDIPAGLRPVTPEKGDLLLSRANTPELVGDVCLVRRDCPRLIVPDLLYRLHCRPEVVPDYLCYFLLSRAARAQIEADAQGSSGSMVKIGQGRVRSWVITLPPLPEQRAIVSYLDRETARIDSLVSRIEAAIGRLGEYRSALITAAVTGKIDVRGFFERSVPASLPPAAAAVTR